MTSFYQNTKIFIAEDFLTESQSEYLISAVESQNKAKWTNNQVTNEKKEYSAFWDGKSFHIEEMPNFDRNVLKEIETKAKLLYEQAYPELKGKVSYSYIFTINRFKSGDSMPVHSDRGPYETNNDILHGFVIYLNDDYEGGEIYYPKKFLSIKPKKYSLVVHPGSEEYEHGVREVTAGERYALTMFTRSRKASI
jgi:predicted 2-oxoglutarate/Fe(II)-dependent dioxygenase YbiX